MIRHRSRARRFGGLSLLLSLVPLGSACARCSWGGGADAAVGDAGEDAAQGEDFESALSGHTRLRYLADLDEIQRRKVVRVLTTNNSTNYFLFRGDEVGFEYELALAFARELGVRLEIVLATARRDLIPMLLEGRADVIAAGLTLSTSRAGRVTFCKPYMSVRNQVVVRKGRQVPLREPRDLLNEMVHVRRSSSYFKQLRDLGRELGQTIPVAAVPESMEAEDLIDMVGRGEIPVTIARSSFLDAELTWRDDIEAAFALPGEEQVAWAVRPDDKKLIGAVDAFFSRHHKDVFFNTLYSKYFRNPKRAGVLRDGEVRADLGGAISPYDEIFKRAARAHALDWRLLAAQAYQESRFDPKARSWAGAVGVMQLMPTTAAQIGVADLEDPSQSIAGGARYLRLLLDRFSPDIDFRQRVRFALAAYNAGRGHVDDARALARRMGLDPNRWFGHVEKAMLRLSAPRVYQEAEHGYVRGEEPVRYVSQIQTRYDIYAKVAPP